MPLAQNVLPVVELTPTPISFRQDGHFDIYTTRSQGQIDVEYNFAEASNCSYDARFDRLSPVQVIHFHVSQSELTVRLGVETAGCLPVLDGIVQQTLARSGTCLLQAGLTWRLACFGDNPNQIFCAARG